MCVRVGSRVVGLKLGVDLAVGVDAVVGSRLRLGLRSSVGAGDDVGVNAGAGWGVKLAAVGPADVGAGFAGGSA